MAEGDWPGRGSHRRVLQLHPLAPGPVAFQQAFQIPPPQAPSPGRIPFANPAEGGFPPREGQTWRGLWAPNPGPIETQERPVSPGPDRGLAPTVLARPACFGLRPWNPPAIEDL